MIGDDSEDDIMKGISRQILRRAEVWKELQRTKPQVNNADGGGEQIAFIKAYQGASVRAVHKTKNC
jgi:hypothetical protein